MSCLIVKKRIPGGENILSFYFWNSVLAFYPAVVKQDYYIKI